MDKLHKVKAFFRPDWSPQESALQGELKGQYGYVTEVGTIKLLGPDPQKDINVPESSVKTKLKGPLLVLSAKSGLL